VLFTSTVAAVPVIGDVASDVGDAALGVGAAPAEVDFLSCNDDAQARQVKWIVHSILV
jgi:hypothetical protein